MLELSTLTFRTADLKAALNSLPFEVNLPSKSNFIYALCKVVDGKLVSPVNLFDWTLEGITKDTLLPYEGKYLVIYGKLLEDFKISPEAILISSVNKRTRYSCIERAKANLSVVMLSCSYFVFTGIYTLNALYKHGSYTIGVITDNDTQAMLTVILSQEINDLTIGQSYRFTGTLTSRALLSKSGYKALILDAEAPEVTTKAKRNTAYFLFKDTMNILTGW